MGFGATAIAAIYKDRWKVELFFKALKQTLKIKTFVGTSANAVRTQVWTALIAMLVLKYLQLKSTFSWSLSNLAALLRQQLFFYRDLWAWLDGPFQAPPALAGLHWSRQPQRRNFDTAFDLGAKAIVLCFKNQPLGSDLDDAEYVQAEINWLMRDGGHYLTVHHGPWLDENYNRTNIAVNSKRGLIILII